MLIFIWIRVKVLFLQNCHGHLSWIFILVCFLSNDSGLPNDEEAIVYRGMSQNGNIVGTSSTQTYTLHSTHLVTIFSRISMSGPTTQANVSISMDFSSFPIPSSSFVQKNIPIGRTSSMPLNVSESLPVSHITAIGRSRASSDTSPRPNSTSWVYLGDIECFKGKLPHLVNTLEGSLIHERHYIYP